MLELDQLLHYWLADQWAANVLMFLHLFGAMVLGLALGYERTYHGRAAGMRTYALVCMSACAVTVLVAYPHQWFGGHLGPDGTPPFTDPTRVMQGVLTGVGFLGAGVIMREGMNISGLTTAASLWVAAALGIVVGMGFYLAAFVLTALCASLMMWGAKLESKLPSHPAIAVTIRGVPARHFEQAELSAFAVKLGYRFAPGSLNIEYRDQCEEWRFVCTAMENYKGQTLTRFSSRLNELPGLAYFKVTHARN